MNATAGSFNPNGSTANPASEELRGVVSQAEKLLNSLEGSGGDTMGRLRERARTAISTAKDRLSTVQSRTRDVVTDAASATDEYVHENPWQTVAYGVVFGIFIGAILGRRL